MEMININSQVGDMVILAINGKGEAVEVGKVCQIDNNYSHYIHNYGKQALTKIWIDITHHRQKRYIGGQSQVIFDNETGNKMF